MGGFEATSESTRLSRPSRASRVSVVIPTYLRESVLVDTVRAVLPQLSDEDEVVIVDQTPTHEVATSVALAELCATGKVRWFRKQKASISEAMNVGALLARSEVVLFLDDDVEPGPGLLDAHREAVCAGGGVHAVNGQVLQPWNEGPVDSVAGFGLDFDFAYSKPAEITGLAAGNLAVLRRVFLGAGGMDETFEGGAYRCDADLGLRLQEFTGRPTRFEPRASVRHLQAGGGTRAHGAKDTWASIGSAVGDHYLGLRWFGPVGAMRHSVERLLRAPFNRQTLKRPWLVASILLRELVAILWAARLVKKGPARGVRPLVDYSDLREEKRPER